MKRPLCVLALILTAAVFIYLELFLSDITGRTPADLEGRYVTVLGTVREKEYRKNFRGEILPVIYLLPYDQDISNYNLIQCYLESSDYLPAIGELAEVSGKAKVFLPPTNPGEFDSRLYYSTLKIKYRITGCKVLRTGGKKDSYREFLVETRMFFETALDQCLSEEDSAIMKAMLLGDKAYMDSEIKELYQGSGIIHILAVSGLHISIIGMGVYELLKRIGIRAAQGVAGLFCGYVEKSKCKGRDRNTERPGRRENKAAFLNTCCLKSTAVCNGVPAVASIAFMYSYGIMCGMGTSSFRAICMFTLRLLAPLFGRTYDVLSALALAEILLLLDQPLYLYNSGFLFSFGAVLGISVVRPFLVPSGILSGREEEKMKFVDDEENSILNGSVLGLLDIRGKGKALFEGIMTSLGILLVTLPEYACFYYTYPVHSLVLNLVVIPVMGVLMILGILCMLLGGAFLVVMYGKNIISVSHAIAAENTKDNIYVSDIWGHILCLLEKLPAALVHMILDFYKWLCSGTSIRSGFTWYMGHAEKWQVFAYVILIALFVLCSWMVREGKIQTISMLCRNSATGPFRNRIQPFGENENGMIPSCRNIGIGRVKTSCRNIGFSIWDIVRGTLIFLAVFILTFRISPDLEIDMIDVGQGDGIVISCEGKHMLIDGGSTSKKNVGKYQIIPVLKYKGIGKLEAVVLTHEDQDHISGIFEILDDMEKGGIRVKQLILPEVAESSRGDNYHKLESRAAELGIPVAYINMGESFSLGKARFTCLNPELNMVSDGANAYSTVLFMEYSLEHRKRINGDNDNAVLDGRKSTQRFTALFTGDVEGAGQDYLKFVIKACPEQYENLTLLKVAHHGSQYTTDEEFLDMVKPKVALISCGKDNSYGHPHQDLLERLDEVGAKVYRTDQGGCIQLSLDGDRVVLLQCAQ